MSLKPAFITGAAAKVVIPNTNRILAFCSDVNFTIDVTVIPIEAIGMMEVVTYEPVAYSASGSMSVMRYAASTIKDAGLGTVGSVAATPTSPIGDLKVGNAANDIAGDYAIFGAHLDPSAYMGSRTFDMDIYTRVQTVGGTPDKPTTDTKFQWIYRIHDARLTRRGNALTKRGVMVDAYNFVATWVEDKSGADLVS